MKALGYLLLTTIKNRLLNLRKKPALFILYLIIIVVIVFFLVNSFDQSSELVKKSYTDIRILYGIVAGLGMLFLFSFVMTGLSTGSTLFNMADVGLLFVSPISSRKILLYGLIKQLGTTALTSVFIIFQTNTIKLSFGLNGGSIIAIFLIYAMILFHGQIVSIAVYIFTNGNPFRKTIVKGILYCIVAIIGGGILVLQMKNGGVIWKNALGLLDSTFFSFIPVAGWAIMFLKAYIESNLISFVIAIVLFAITGILMIAYFTSGDADYYEDVLTSTEITFRRLQDAKDGKRTSTLKKVKVKEKETGIRKGKGCSVIFYKHLLEKRRTSRFLYLDTYTILVSIGAAIFCKYMNKEISVYIILGILVYLQFFMTILGKLSMELSKPYIYLIPDKSMKKVLAASVTTLLKPCFDAVIIFTMVCIASKTSPLLNLFLGLAYASSAAIFVSYTLLCQRIFGGQPNKIISGILGMTLFMVVLAPGVGVSVAAILMLPASLTFLGTFPFTFCCIVITIFTFVVCGDLLDKTEYTGK